MKTKGALIWEFNQPWSVEEIEIGDPRKDEVKIQMEAAGMCRSDHHLVTGDIPMAGFPVLGGHEGAGIVTEVGPGVDDFAPGDHVVLAFIPSCGKCPSCQAGMRNLCDLGAGLLAGESVTDGSFRIQARGQNVYPMTLLGTFFTVHGGAPQLGGEDRPVGALRSRLPGWLRRHHRLWFGGPHGRRPAGRRRGHRRLGWGRHGGVAGRGQRGRPLRLRGGAGGMET